MNRIIFTIILATVCFTSWSQGWRRNEMEVKVQISHSGDLQKLTGVSTNIEPAANDGSVFRAYLVPAEFDLLKKTGLSYQVSIPDLNKHYEHFWDNALVPPGYYTYEQIIAIADSLALNFPSICKKEIWGTSLGGRQLAALKISDNVNANETEPEIMFDGGIHGDEVGGPQNVIMFARDLCLGYGVDPVITDLINTREIWLYLMVNPDGRVSMSRYNNNGVDVNRDNGYMWEGEGNSPGPFSQVETKALRDGILRNQFVVYTNYHSGTEIIAFPWSYRSDAPRDYAQINQLASVYSSTSGYAGGMQFGQGYNVMYAINGSTKDVQYGSLGQVGWSIEISNDKQPPSNMINYYYSINKPAMLEIIKDCGYGISGMITDSVTGEAVRGSVWVDNYYPVYNDPVAGDYHKYILPGTYSVKFRANGYKTKSFTGLNVPSAGTLVKDVQLVPDTGWYSYKLLNCRIPGNNFGDEGYTPGCISKPDGTPYSMGRNGYLTLDMGDTLYDGPGADFKVFQSGTTAKSFTVSGSHTLDGPFTVIGTGNGTTSFDIGPSLLGRVRYLYIKDNGSGSASGTGAGFNLDAVSMITPPLKVAISASSQNPCTGTAVNFTDHSKGNVVSWNWSFPGGVPASSTQQNPTGIVYPAAGTYAVVLTISNGVSSLGKTFTGYITVLQAPVVNLGIDTIICDYDHLTLHAGNPGSTYQWSTGATTESIVADSSGVGIGTKKYWVRVTAPTTCAVSDTIAITFDKCEGISQTDGSAGVQVRPNPAGENTEIIIKGFRGGNWRLTNTSGEMIFSGTIEADTTDVRLDLSKIPDGVAVLHVMRDQTIVIKKIIILHTGR